MTEHVQTQPYVETHPTIVRALDSIGTVFDSLKWAACFSRLCQEELLCRGLIDAKAMERISCKVNDIA